LQLCYLLEKHRGTWFTEEPVQRLGHLYVPLEGRRADMREWASSPGFTREL
jgi:hypothetical protein